MNNKKLPAAPQNHDDPICELARSIYIGMCRTIYSVSDSKKPEPKAVARLSLRLAEAFVSANHEFNPIAKAAREAEEAAALGGHLDIDFASIGAHRDINAPSRFGTREATERAVRLARAA
jgi:hypothetical protein